MRADLFDRWSYSDSRIHRLPAALKLAVALAMVIVTVVLPVGRWDGFIVIALLLIGVAAASRVPGTFILRRLVTLEPLALGVAGLAMFQPHGGRIFATMLVKTTLCLLTMILLSSTTPFSALLDVMKRARVPDILVSTLALMYRYLFVLADEAQRMRRARASRTFRPGRWWTWHALGSVIGQLFVRSTERAERIYAAMIARGWS
jgi:cobalt/nickel transport system permease protein